MLRLWISWFQNLYHGLQENPRTLPRVEDVICVAQCRFVMAAKSKGGRIAPAAHLLKQQFSLIQGDAVADDDQIKGPSRAKLDRMADGGD